MMSTILPSKIAILAILTRDKMKLILTKNNNRKYKKILNKKY